MSAHAGVLCPPGAVDEARALDTLDRHLISFGPDGAVRHVAPGIGMLARSLHVRPEDAFTAPILSSEGCFVTWDGRLDNRSDLLAQLCPATNGSRLPDTAIVLCAYERWGLGAFARFVGDWSAVIWDPRTRSVHLASDFSGNRPLFYASVGDCFLWASTLGPLVSALEGPPVAPEFAAGYLTASIAPGVTPFTGIHVVPPAHAVTRRATEIAVRLHRFWDFTFDRRSSATPCASQDAADECRELVKTAVGVRLHASQPVWAELSGGLDSSTIVCVAHRLRHAGRSEWPIPTVSCVAARGPDERRFIAAVEEHCGAVGHHVAIEQCESTFDEAAAWLTPKHPRNAVLALYRLVLAHGGRSLMSGHAGDVVFGNHVDSESQVIASLEAGRPIRAVGLARRSALASRGTTWQLLARSAAALMPAETYRRVLARRLLDDQGAPLVPRGTPSAKERFFLSRDGVEHWQQETARRVTRALALGPRHKARMLMTLTSLLDDRSFQTPSELPGLKVTFPFLHRPLVEFLASVSPDLLSTPDRPRALMRDAFQDVLPEIVARRFSKGRISELQRRRVIRDFAERFHRSTDTLHVVQAGFVDGEALRPALDAVVRDGLRSLKNLVEIVRFEGWLRLYGQRRRSLSGALPVRELSPTGRAS